MNGCHEIYTVWPARALRERCFASCYLNTSKRLMSELNTVSDGVEFAMHGHVVPWLALHLQYDA